MLRAAATRTVAPASHATEPPGRARTRQPHQPARIFAHLPGHEHVIDEQRERPGAHHLEGDADQSERRDGEEAAQLAPGVTGEPQPPGVHVPAPAAVARAQPPSAAGGSGRRVPPRAAAPRACPAPPRPRLEHRHPVRTAHGREPVRDHEGGASARSRSSASSTAASVCVSSALVGSSRIRMGASRSSARAIASRCRSPQESVAPRSASTVW